jgi:hypothetical protein
MALQLAESAGELSVRQAAMGIATITIAVRNRRCDLHISLPKNLFSMPAMLTA